MAGLGLVGSKCRIARHIRVLRVVLLHLELLDTVCELDHLDAASEAGLCKVGLDFGQQVVVGCGIAAEPGVSQGLLLIRACVSVAVFKDVRLAQHNMRKSYLTCPSVLRLGL